MHTKTIQQLPIVEVKTNELTDHPTAAQIYVVDDVEALKTTIQADGLFEPILVDDCLRIIAGRRKVAACKELGWDVIPAKVLKGYTEQELMAVILGSNRQRVKSTKECLLEAELALNLIPKSQGKRRDIKPDCNDPENSNKGKDRVQLAVEKTGNSISATTFRSYQDVKQFELDHPSAKLNLVERIFSGDIAVSKAVNLVEDYSKKIEEKQKVESTVIAPTFHKTSNWQIAHSSALDLLRNMEDNSIDCFCFSPPYFNARKYGKSELTGCELGLEKTVAQYIENLLVILKEIHRVMKPTGSCWVNIGDTYDYNERYLVSNRLLIACCDNAGFYCPNEVIWSKLNFLPQYDERRMQPSYEKVFHLVKSPTEYFYRPFKFIGGKKEPKIYKITRRNNRGGFDKSIPAISNPYKKFADFIVDQEFYGVLRSTPAGPESAIVKMLDNTVDHPAIAPISLFLIPILSTTLEGQKICDPFCGTSSTGVSCVLLNRQFIGGDINKAFFDLSIKRLTEVDKQYNHQDSIEIETLFTSRNNIDITDFHSSKAA